MATSIRYMARPRLFSSSFSRSGGFNSSLHSLGGSSSRIPHRPTTFSITIRSIYTPLTPSEEETEKKRVADLSAFQKDQELRSYNRKLAKLEILKGINTGERYTWTGRYKQLARDYGMPLVAYYWVAWTGSAIVCYSAITIFQIDTVALLSQVDASMGWDLVSKVDPEMGKIGMAILVNELLEPIRLPAVIVTVKPVMDRLFPPKY